MTTLGAMLGGSLGLLMALLVGGDALTVVVTTVVQMGIGGVGGLSATMR